MRKLQLCYLFLTCCFITFVVLGQTLVYPFFTIDDSDVLDKAQKFLDTHGVSAYAKAFVPELAVNRRYWPGFHIYILLRTQLFGFSSVAWHTFQILLISSIGFFMAVFSYLSVKSIWPGLGALLIVLSAGTFNYQSNWFNYVFTNTFEPILMLLWVSAIFFFTAAGLSSSRKVQISSISAALLVTLFSITVKENAFLVTGAMSGVLLGWSVWKRKSFPQSQWAAAGLLIASVGWGLWVYNVIPKDEGYAGTSTLNHTPSQLWHTLKEYAQLVYQTTGVYILAGLVLGIVRQIAARKVDMLYAIATAFSFFQIASVIIWPEVSMRLIFPAFIALALASTTEYWHFLKSIQNQPQNIIWLAGGVLVAAIAMVLATQEGVLALLICSLAILLIASGIYFFSKPEIFHSALFGFGCCVIVLFGAGLFVNGISNTISYPIVYKTTELTRHLTVQKAAELGPENAKVLWILDPGQEIFPYSCDIHARLFFDRPDLEILPHTALDSTTTSLKRGDMIVLYGSRSRYRLQDKALMYMPVIQAGYIGPVLSYPEYLTDFCNLLLGDEKEEKPVSNYYEGTVHMYQVIADSWAIPPPLIK